MRTRANGGFSAIEMLVVVAISGVLGAIAIPSFVNSVKGYRVNAASAAISGAIQATRFQAIMQGYQYQLVLTRSNLSYQISNMVPPATTFSNVGSAVPIAHMGDVTLNAASLTYTFYANGTVSGPGTPLQLSKAVTSNTITVSGVGNVSITTP